MIYDPKEREQLERDIAERQRQIDRANTLEWAHERNAARNAYTPDEQAMIDAYSGTVDRTPRSSATVNKGMPAAASRSSAPFTPGEMKLLEPLTAAIGEKLAEMRDKAAESQRQIREEMQEFTRREVDRMAQRLRNEALQDRLDVERQWRAAEQERRHRGAAGLGVNEMIELNPNDVN